MLFCSFISTHYLLYYQQNTLESTLVSILQTVAFGVQFVLRHTLSSILKPHHFESLSNSFKSVSFFSPFQSLLLCLFLYILLNMICVSMYRPEFGGKYCTGERKRYRICNTKPCARKQPSFREMQCSEFNTVPYHNELYEWKPVASSCKSTLHHMHQHIAFRFVYVHDTKSIFFSQHLNIVI